MSRSGMLGAEGHLCIGARHHFNPALWQALEVGLFARFFYCTHE
jgi:hypothetical protein